MNNFNIEKKDTQKPTIPKMLQYSVITTIELSSYISSSLKSNYTLVFISLNTNGMI